MLKTKKLLAAVMAGAMALSMTACGGGDAKQSAGGSDANAAAAGGDSFTVGICQLAPHPALDAATQGFKDKLTELLEADGKSVKFLDENANGDQPTCNTVVNKFVSSNVDLILANATAPLQAAASATDSIPILGTSISDYGTALDDPDMTDTTGRNISGTTDLAPLDKQATIFGKWFPDAKNVGLLYCSSEPNSKYQIETIKPYLEDLGYNCTEYTFSDSNDLATVVNKAAQKSDAIYVPTDNAAADNTGIIANAVIPAKVPVFAGEEGICTGCGVATLSISYYELGQTTAEMAYDILVNGKDVSTMPIQSAPNVTEKYNADICQQLGLTPPDSAEAIESAEG